MPTTLLLNNFETSDGGWTGANATLVRSTTNPAVGTYCLQITATSATGSATGRSSMFACQPGTRFTTSLKLRPEINKRGVYLSINWFDSAGAYLSTSSGSDAAFIDATSLALGAYSTFTFSATPPTGAAQAQVVVDNTTPAVGDILRVDDVLVTVPDAVVPAVTHTLSATSGTAPLTVTMTGAVANSPAGTKAWTFHWGDGSPNTGPQASNVATHTYAGAGSFSTYVDLDVT